MINGTRYRLDAEIGRQTRLASEIARGQIQISTQKRLLAPSDDPAAAATIAQIGRQQVNESTWTTNLAAAGALASRGDQAIKNLTSDMDRVLELMTNAATATSSDQNRATIAIELRSIAQGIDALADTRDARGGAVFRSNGLLEIPVSPNTTVAATNSREAVFESVQTAGGVTSLSALIRAAADAITESDLVARAAATKVSLDAVQNGVDHVAAVASDQGLRAARIDALADRLDQSAIQLEDERNNLEATDLPKTISKVESTRLSLEAAQAVFARINQSSLFDLLR